MSAAYQAALQAWQLTRIRGFKLWRSLRLMIRCIWWYTA
jgi:hypothetical protein